VGVMEQMFAAALQASGVFELKLNRFKTSDGNGLKFNCEIRDANSSLSRQFINIAQVYLGGRLEVHSTA
jgi:hypothetical protein